jgi:hypothetical protein
MLNPPAFQIIGYLNGGYNQTIEFLGQMESIAKMIPMTVGYKNG